MSKSVLEKASYLAWPAITLCVAVAFVALALPGTAAENTGHNGLVGTWNFKATSVGPIPPGFPPNGFEGVETFNSDGTMHVVTNLPGVTIGSGAWKQTGPGRFTFTFTFYRQDPSSLLLLATRVQENVRITNGGATYETTDAIMPLDAAGNPLPFCGGPCIFRGTVQASRYQFATFNTLLP